MDFVRLLFVVVGVVWIATRNTVDAICGLFWSRIFSCEFISIPVDEVVQRVYYFENCRRELALHFPLRLIIYKFSASNFLYFLLLIIGYWFSEIRLRAAVTVLALELCNYNSLIYQKLDVVNTLSTVVLLYIFIMWRRDS